jgi:hypothetical protein
MNNRMGTAVVTLALLAGGISLAAPASAATTEVGCSAETCYDQDPVEMGCQPDSGTIGSVQTDDGLVELRYSRACHAKWVRLSYGTGRAPNIWVKNADGQYVQFQLPLIAKSGWSNMVNGRPKAFAGSGAVASSPNTGWH